MSFGGHSFLLAPIRGVTDLAYRNAIQRYFPGFDGALAPYLPLGRDQARLDRALLQLRPEHNQLPTQPQLLCNSLEHFLPLARELHAMGHASVNLDLGCPYPMVTDRKLGARLLAEPKRLISLLDALVAESPIKLALKMRLGYDDSRDCEAIVPAINRLGIDDVTIHARIAKDLYRGPVDVDAFDRVAQKLNTVPTYNGSICSRADLETFAARLSYVRSWMIGRGALSDLGLVSRLKGGKPADFRGTLKSLHDDVMEAIWGKSHLVDHMRGHWKYWADAFVDPTRLFKAFKKARNIADYLKAKDWAFTQPTLF